MLTACSSASSRRRTSAPPPSSRRSGTATTTCSPSPPARPTGPSEWPRTTTLETPDARRYRVEGTDGWLAVEEAFVPRDDDGATLEYSVDGRHAVEEFDPTDQYRLEVEAFADAVESGTAPGTDATEAARNMAVIDALSDSAARGEPVDVEMP